VGSTEDTDSDLKDTESHGLDPTSHPAVGAGEHELVVVDR